MSRAYFPEAQIVRDNLGTKTRYFQKIDQEPKYTTAYKQLIKLKDMDFCQLPFHLVTPSPYNSLRRSHDTVPTV